MTPGEVLSGVRPWALVLGDCLDPVTGLACLPDWSVDHVITDPPYEAEAHTQQRRIRLHSSNGSRGRVNSAPLDFEAITPEVRMGVGLESGRLSRRWTIVFCQVEAVPSWASSLTGGGAVYKRACVWIKPDGQPQLTGDRPGMGYETIVTAHAKGKSRWNAGGKIGVYEAVRHQDHGPRHERHMTVKPLPLMEQLIRDFTDPGDVVVDPFAGSGTTGVACIRLGRRFIGWERDPKFHAAAMRRLEGTTEQPELLAVESFRREAKKKRKQGALALGGEK